MHFKNHAYDSIELEKSQGLNDGLGWGNERTDSPSVGVREI